MGVGSGAAGGERGLPKGGEVQRQGRPSFVKQTAEMAKERKAQAPQGIKAHHGQRSEYKEGSGVCWGGR